MLETFNYVSGKHTTEANHQVNTITLQDYCTWGKAIIVMITIMITESPWVKCFSKDTINI